jgi:spermidine/putrescine transport system ATP-binding protein
MNEPAERAPEIRLVELTKDFREVRAVDRVSVDIRSGEFFSLLGPSGCGKTTTLRMIGGFELPTAGRVELRGRDITVDPPDKRPVNMVFQHYALFPHLDVGENVAFGLRRRSVDGREIKRRVAEALELVRLAGYERRRPNQLSGGQQQRVALARALVNQPTVLLLDEPLGALDLKLRRQLQVELKRIQSEVGITFVYVTHDQEEALAMSDRIAVMSGGRIEQVGTPEQLYDRPATRFVADFIGTTNLLPGVVASAERGATIVRLDSGDECRVVADGIPQGRRVDVSVRPEAVLLVSRSSSASRSIGGRVDQVAYLGTAVQYRVQTGGGLSITALAPKGGPRLAPGDEVLVSWSPDDALVLESQSEHNAMHPPPARPH